MADLGTKSFNGSRVKLLLHELGVTDNNGQSMVGEREYQEQVEKHGSRRQVMQIARNLCRVFALLGLELVGAACAVFSDNGQQDHCDAVDNSSVSAIPTSAYIFILLLMI